MQVDKLQQAPPPMTSNAILRGSFRLTKTEYPDPSPQCVPGTGTFSHSLACEVSEQENARTATQYRRARIGTFPPSKTCPPV
jgi:hypothetical protein